MKFTCNWLEFLFLNNVCIFFHQIRSALSWNRIFDKIVPTVSFDISVRFIRGKRYRITFLHRVPFLSPR